TCASCRCTIISRGTSRIAIAISAISPRSASGIWITQGAPCARPPDGTIERLLGKAEVVDRSAGEAVRAVLGGAHEAFGHLSRVLLANDRDRVELDVLEGEEGRRVAVGVHLRFPAAVNDGFNVVLH